MDRKMMFREGRKVSAGEPRSKAGKSLRAWLTSVQLCVWSQLRMGLLAPQPVPHVQEAVFGCIWMGWKGCQLQGLETTLAVNLDHSLGAELIFLSSNVSGGGCFFYLEDVYMHIVLLCYSKSFLIFLSLQLSSSYPCTQTCSRDFNYLCNVIIQQCVESVEALRGICKARIFFSH